MMKRKIVICALALGFALGATACGGGSSRDDGGNGGTGQASLTTEDGVKAALGNIGASFQAIAGPEDGGFKSTGLNSPAGRSIAAQRSRLKSTTQPCSDGGTETVEEGTKTETFRFYDNMQVPVSFIIFDLDNCRETFNGSTFIANGHEEFGDSTSSTFPFFFYGDFGQDNTPFSLRFITSGTDLTTTFLGRFEEREGNSDFDDRLAMDVTVVGQDGSDNLDIAFQFGRRATMESFRINEQDSDGSVTLNGRMAFQTPACTGDFTLQTLQRLTFSGDFFPSSGQLRVTSGNESVEYSFSGDTVSWVNHLGNSGTFDVDSIPDGC